MIYAAYGSNMNIPQMAVRCPAAKKLGIGVIKGYKLEFCVVATIKPCVGKDVPVVLWDLTKDCEDDLDIYEGFPHYYTKETLSVYFRGKTVEAMVYIMTPPQCKKPTPPSPTYLKTIIAGYEQNGIPWD